MQWTQFSFMQSGHSGSLQIGRQHALSLAKSVTFRFCGMFQRVCAGPSSWMTSSRSSAELADAEDDVGLTVVPVPPGPDAEGREPVGLRQQGAQRLRGRRHFLDRCARHGRHQRGPRLERSRQLLQEGGVGIGRRRLEDDVALEQQLADVTQDLLVDQPALPPPREPRAAPDDRCLERPVELGRDRRDQVLAVPEEEPVDVVDLHLGAGDRVIAPAPLVLDRVVGPVAADDPAANVVDAAAPQPTAVDVREHRDRPDVDLQLGELLPGALRVGLVVCGARVDVGNRGGRRRFLPRRLCGWVLPRLLELVGRRRDVERQEVAVVDVRADDDAEAARNDRARVDDGLEFDLEGHGPPVSPP